MKNRLSLSVSLGAVMLLSTGCAAVPFVGIGANFLGMNALAKSSIDRKADRCYALTKEMEAKKFGSAEMTRERTKAGC